MTDYPGLMSTDPLDRLRGVAERQWGLVTAAQMRTAGVSRSALTHAIAEGRMLRVLHGVYEFPDSEQWSSFGDWAAHWLALEPSADIDVRRARPDSVVSHAAAAQLQQLGVLVSPVLEISAPRRIRSRTSGGIRAHRAAIGDRGRDWHVVQGFPVTTAARTIGDLLASHGDGGHIGTVITAALETGAATETEVLAACARAARRWGHRPDDGTSLLDSLLASSLQPA